MEGFNEIGNLVFIIHLNRPAISSGEEARTPRKPCASALSPDPGVLTVYDICCVWGVY